MFTVHRLVPTAHPHGLFGFAGKSTEITLVARAPGIRRSSGEHFRITVVSCDVFTRDAVFRAENALALRKRFSFKRNSKSSAKKYNSRLKVT